MTGIFVYSKQDKMDYKQVLDIFQKNYIEYKMTGNAAYKVAYERAQEHLEKYIQTLKQDATTESEYIQKFVQNYRDTNPELAKLGDQMKQIRTQGPAIQDTYNTAKQLFDETEVQEDTTPYYIKGVVVAGLVGIISALAFF